jgi:hypothetical protein
MVDRVHPEDPEMTAPIVMSEREVADELVRAMRWQNTVYPSVDRAHVDCGADKKVIVRLCDTVTALRAELATTRSARSRELGTMKQRQQLAGDVQLIVDHDATCSGKLRASFTRVVNPAGFLDPSGLVELRVVCDRCDDVQLLFVKTTIAQRDPP